METWNEGPLTVYAAHIVAVTPYHRGLSVDTDAATNINIEPTPAVPVEPGMTIIIGTYHNLVKRVVVDGVTVIDRPADLAELQPDAPRNYNLRNENSRDDRATFEELSKALARLTRRWRDACIVEIRMTERPWYEADMVLDGGENPTFTLRCLKDVRDFEKLVSQRTRARERFARERFAQ